MSTADPRRLGYAAGRGRGRDSDSWYTPARYVEAVRTALGHEGIALDPFSSREANAVVGADLYYTEEDDAFRQDWRAPTVFMNPPYSGRLVLDAVRTFLDRYDSGAFARGIILMNATTDTRAGQLVLRRALAVCFTDHRIAFWNADGKAISGNTKGQMFAYFGPSGTDQQFREEFAEIGAVMSHG